MAVLLGSFETQSQAEDAVDRLRRAGFEDNDLSLISHAGEAVGTPEDDSQRASTQVDISVAGGAAGAVLGGFLLGPVGAVIGGMLAGGGLAAALRPHGITDEEAAEYERRLHQGRYVLAVQVDTDERAGEARRTLTAAGADKVDVDR